MAGFNNTNVEQLYWRYGDGTETEITRYNGDFAVDGEEEGNRALIPVQIRGRHSGFAPGADKQIEGSFSVAAEATAVTSAVAVTILDLINKTGFVLSDGKQSIDGCFWTGTLVRKITNCSVVQTFVYANCRFTVGTPSSEDVSAYNVSFTCYGGVTRS